MKLSSEELTQLAQMLAFAGNSLLKPMNQTSTVGLDAAFWGDLPSFESEEAASTLNVLAAWASAIDEERSEDAVRGLSVEYARLFMGPPEPAVMPWETFYAEEGSDTGFGEQAFAMVQRLRSLGLSVSNDNNQYADHIGIELLYVSECLKRASQGDDSLLREAAAFSRDSAIPWMRSFSARVYEADSTYYSMLSRLACALLSVVAAQAD